MTNRDSGRELVLAAVGLVGTLTFVCVMFTFLPVIGAPRGESFGVFRRIAACLLCLTVPLGVWLTLRLLRLLLGRSGG